jgi:acetate kinase
MAATILTLNAGSSTIKVALYDVGAGAPERRARGVADLRAEPPRLRLTADGSEREIPLAHPDDPEAVLAAALDAVRDIAAGPPAAVAHRVVHGGNSFAGPVRIDDAVIDALEALTVLAPLHQPQALRLVRAMRALAPGIVQVASFDTAFHRSMPDRNRRFALPRALHDEGIKRYGFHGLSYASIAATLRRDHPALAAGRVVAAHLGSGASLCAMADGVSRDTSMGFSTLDGVPMATRCGALDAGVVLHLLGPGGRPIAEVEDTLYHRAGLLGVSGLSADTRVLLESPAAEAREALDLFAFRVAGEVARLAVSLGGLDALVFSAGIGENQPEVRAAVAALLGWLGLSLDPAANDAGARSIAAEASRIACLVVPTDEEQVLAREAASILMAGGDAPS